MAEAVPATVLDEHSRAFHSPANISLGCAQVRGLFWPLSCDLFVQDYFELRHHLTRSSSVHEDVGTALGFPSLLRTADVHRMASVWEFKVGADHSQARMIRPNSFSHDPEWAEGAAVDGAALRRAHVKNCTLVFHNVELYWRPIGLLSLSLTRLFGVYSQANVYFSPPALGAALHAHQDAQSVFVVQCEGRKTWTLLEPPVRWKLRYNQRGKAGDTAPREELSQPIDEVRRRAAGDGPRGPHRHMLRHACHLDAPMLGADDSRAGRRALPASRVRGMRRPRKPCARRAPAPALPLTRSGRWSAQPVPLHRDAAGRRRLAARDHRCRDRHGRLHVARSAHRRRRGAQGRERCAAAAGAAASHRQ